MEFKIFRLNNIISLVQQVQVQVMAGAGAGGKSSDGLPYGDPAYRVYPSHNMYWKLKICLSKLFQAKVKSWAELLHILCSVR